MFDLGETEFEVVGAVLIVGSAVTGVSAPKPGSLYSTGKRQRPLACVEVLGQSVLERTIERLRAAGVTSISVVGSGVTGYRIFEERRKLTSADPPDPWHRATQKVFGLKTQGIDAILIQSLDSYVEFSPAEMFQFYREQRGEVVRAYDEKGALDLWVVNPAALPEGEELSDYLQACESSQYPVQCYVNRLESPRDLRRLIGDSFASRCKCQPQGVEVRPGIWMAHGAQVERAARIVAPAFIGRGAKIADQCLITRCSDVESNSQIDYGTVVEDSTVMPNTYVGIGLDLSHSIVDGNNLLNLRHGVMLEISDPVVLRSIPEGRIRGDMGRRFPANLEFDEMAVSGGMEIRR